MSDTRNRPLFSVRELCATALGAALMTICAWISIPTEMPFTLQTFAILLVTGLLGLKCGTLSVVVYLLMGAVGLPVFTGFRGGLGSLVGVTGGYLLGFVFTAAAVGIGTKYFGKSVPVLIVSMALGIALCYAFGSAWYMLLYTSASGPVAVTVVLAKCVVPFLVPDAVKMLLAVVLIKRLERMALVRIS